MLPSNVSFSQGLLNLMTKKVGNKKCKPVTGSMNVHRRNKIDETWTIYNPINEWVYLVAELGYIGKGGQSNNFKI